MEALKAYYANQAAKNVAETEEEEEKDPEEDVISNDDDDGALHAHDDPNKKKRHFYGPAEYKMLAVHLDVHGKT